MHTPVSSTASAKASTLVVSVILLVLGLLAAFHPVHAANYNFDTDIDLVLSGFATPLKILSGSKADTLDIQATTFAVTVLGGDTFTVRYPGPNPGLLSNTGTGAVTNCNNVSGNNDVTVTGPASLTFTPSVNLCSAPPGGGGGGGGGGGAATVTVSQPNGGETLSSGSSYQIVWGSGGTGISSIRLLLSIDGGATYPTVISSSEFNDGAYSWTVPLVTTTSTAKIRVQAIGSGEALLSFDESNGNFTIQGTPPSGGGGGGGGGGGSPAPTPAPVPTPPSLPPVPEGAFDPVPYTAAELLAPVTDPFVAGTYTASGATAATPSIDVDKGIVPPQGRTLPCIGGNLLRTVDNSAVYYCGRDGRRYVFPNAGAYFSWYADFSTVKVIMASTMASIPIGANITYRSGVRMIKIQSDPKVYAVARNGTLRWVKDESVALRLYGQQWNKMIHDVDVAFFINYQLGAPIE